MGSQYLDGGLKDLSLQVGANTQEVIELDIPALDAQSLGLGVTYVDFIGAELNINLNGLCNDALGAAAIEINGQALSSVAEDASVQTLLKRINELEGVSTSAILALTAETAGSGALGGGDSVTITGVDLDGGQFSISVSNTENLRALAEAMDQ